MKPFALGFFVMLPGVLLFQQSELEVVFEQLEVIQYNTSYVKFAKTHNFKYKRTQTATNASFHFKKDFGNELVVEVQAYKFASNEYRFFPIRFMFSFCEYISESEFGLANILQFRGNDSRVCPMKQGSYDTCIEVPDSKQFPPHIPQGSYKTDLMFFYRSVECMFLEGYGTAKYPPLWKKI